MQRNHKHVLKAVGAMSLLGAMILGVQPGPALADNMKSLRGETAINELDATPGVYGINEKARLDRAYRQQPPLIPHRIEKYEVDMKVNQCLSCHDWTNAAEHGAPKVSETHYVTRDGVQVDEVARTRWFCTQCHVPQTDARPLVENTFTPSR